MTTILIVDDLERYRTKYAALTQKLGFEVELAVGVKDGIEKLVNMPDAVVTDKDMDDGTGNDVAKAAKDMYPDIPVLGITGGNPQDFNPAYVDIRLSKIVSDEFYCQAVQDLTKGNYSAYQADNSEDREYELAFHILLQGFNIATRLINGEQPVEGVELPIPDREQTQNLFDLDILEMDPDMIAQRISSYVEFTPQVAELFNQIKSKRFDQIDVRTTQYLENEMTRHFQSAYGQ